MFQTSATQIHPRQLYFYQCQRLILHTLNHSGARTEQVKNYELDKCTIILLLVFQPASLSASGMIYSEHLNLLPRLIQQLSRLHCSQSPLNHSSP